MFREKLPLKSLLFYFILLLPLWMWIAWSVFPLNPLAITIIDKTVLNNEVQEHASLIWVLRQDKFSKKNGELYVADQDYKGFYPKQNEQYRITGLETNTKEQIEALSNSSEAVYFADTYGVYYKDWYAGKAASPGKPLLYGGLSAQDLSFLKLMKKKKKLIITEFNTFATPTSKNIASSFEKEFKIKWSGWVGRYFESFDTTVNKEIPPWIVSNYKKQNNNKWPFKNSGVAFVNDSKKIVILEYIKDLINEVPVIYTQKRQRERFNLPKSIKYPFWFDITETSHANNIVSFYDLKINHYGKKKLADNNIPTQFPAVIEHYGNDYKFYYFCGDFSDNPISHGSSSFAGIRLFRRLFFDKSVASERVSFFWEFYDPLVSGILANYKSEL